MIGKGGSGARFIGAGVLDYFGWPNGDEGARRHGFDLLNAGTGPLPWRMDLELIVWRRPDLASSNAST